VHDGDAGDQCEQVKDEEKAGRRVRGRRWMQYPVIQQQLSQDAKLKEVTVPAAAATVSAAAVATAAKCKCKINKTNTHNDTNWIQDGPVEMDDEPPQSEMLSAASTVSVSSKDTVPVPVAPSRYLSLHDPLSNYSPPHRAAQPLLQSSDACPTSWGLHRHIALFTKYSLLFVLLLAATAPYFDSCMSLMCLERASDQPHANGSDGFEYRFKSKSLGHTHTHTHTHTDKLDITDINAHRRRGKQNS